VNETKMLRTTDLDNVAMS